MQFIDTERDPWRLLAEADADAREELGQPQAHSLLSVAQWQLARPHWPADLPVGLVLPNTFDPEGLANDLRATPCALALLVLEFPKWTDGRAYSQARLLRARFGFSGEIRARGDVLVDMLPLLSRTGFDAVQPRSDQKIDAAQRALGFFAGHYQGDIRQPQPLFARSAA